MANAGLPYELRIGVTGHCEIEDAAALQRTVEAMVREQILGVLNRAATEPFGVHGSALTLSDRWFRALSALLSPVSVLAHRLLGTPVVPYAPRVVPSERRTRLDLTVITSLAPGSDQLIARAICSCVPNPQQRNRTLEAVLPIPEALYRDELDEEEDRERFDELIALDRGASRSHPHPTVVHPDFPHELDAGSGAVITLEQAYRNAGRHVVDASEILFAVWDPTRSARPGGTEETIRYAVERGRVVLWLDPAMPSEGLRLFRAATGEEPPESRVADGLCACPPPIRAKRLSPNFHRLAAFNRDAALDAEAVTATLEAEETHLEAAGSEAGLPRDVIDVLKTRILPHFARADHLALRYQSLRNFVTVMFPTISAFALTLIAFQILFYPQHYFVAGIELALILVGYLSYRLSVREAWHEKWLNDRHLAERLRTALYTAVIPGERRPSKQGAGRSDPNWLPFYRPTNEWFADTLARLMGQVRRVLDVSAADSGTAPAALAAFLRTGWIDPHVRYHQRAAERLGRAERLAHGVTVATLTAIVCVASAHAVGVGHQHQDSSDPLLRIDLWIALLTISIPAWGAAFQAIDALSDHPRLAERAGRMVELLRGLSDRLGRIDSIEGLRAQVSDARRIVELENHEMVESFRTRIPRYHG